MARTLRPDELLPSMSFTSSAAGSVVNRRPDSIFHPYANSRRVKRSTLLPVLGKLLVCQIPILPQLQNSQQEYNGANAGVPEPEHAVA